jgi:phosphomannomutase
MIKHRPNLGEAMSDIHFGTDGWRAIIGEDFNEQNLIRVIDAAAKIFAQDNKNGEGEDATNAEGRPVLYVGHDCRQDAHHYAEIAADTAARHGFDVKLTLDYCPTPTLCWSVAHDAQAIGGIMLTSSHNPAEYLGVKLRMADGGASPKEFTDRVEAQMDTTCEETATTADGSVEVVDLMPPYLDALKALVDADAIRNAGLKVVVDPLFGAGRGYLAGILRDLGVEVIEINNACDPTFDGLHPEPIPPWIDRGLAKVKELGYDALFINDGDADRIGAGDSRGNFVNPHRIITLITKHMVDRGESGRVVSTITASALLDRACRKLGLELVSTPVGFKWIYGEMERGGVMVGGEESGGIGLPGHVKERDGLLMALLLTEMMAQTGKDLGTLVDEMLEELGTLEFARRGLNVTDEQMQTFRNHTVPEFAPTEIRERKVVGTDRRDGVKFMLEGDAWVMMRPSGTEPLVRIYAEAETTEEVDALLDYAAEVVAG